MRRRVAGAIFSALLLFASGCGQSGGTGGGATKPAAQSFTLVVSGDTAGFIVPCGCASKQFGGMPRRATYMTQLRGGAENVLYADAGGSVSNATRYDEIKLSFIWKGLSELKPTAVNIGSGEARMGAERLKAAAQATPLVSCNVRVSGGEAPWPMSITQNANGLKIAWTGVLLASEKTGAGLEVQDGMSALQALAPALAREHDLVIALVYGDATACENVARAFPEIHVVLATGMSQPIAPKTVGSSVFAAAAQKGKFLAKVNLEGSRAAWRLKGGEIVELSESYADDAGQMKNLAAYKSALKNELLDPAQTGQVPALLAGLPEHFKYAGSESCAKCHVADEKTHAHSKHFHGLETLTARDFDADPYCLKCHTTGYGGPAGFTNIKATPGLGGIGCESCHGPSKAHVLDPLKKTPVPGASACMTCHDPENSPTFEYGIFWPKIDHGKEKVDRKLLNAVLSKGAQP